MENQRLFLIIAIVVVGMLIYTNFEREKSERRQLIADSKNKNKTGVGIPGSKKSTPAIPAKPGKTAAGKSGKKSDVVAATGGKEVVVGKNGKSKKSSVGSSGNLVNVKTDVYDINIDTKGGDIVQVDLLKYSVSVKNKTPLRLLKKTGGIF